MPLKSTKKLTSKKKQNGKKVVKSQIPKPKQKYEMESSPKEQISELDKEILTINIHESESKLIRKKQLCSYMEEEISVYKILYDEKQLIKSESMKLLNKAFEDFATEICLLGQELDAMQHVHNEILRKEKMYFSRIEKVELLSAVETKLVENLSESEKCHEELVEFNKVFLELKGKASTEKENFKFTKKELLKDYETCLFRIQNELNWKVNEAIEDNTLKLDLLPLPYKTLFLSGWLSNAWLDSAATFYEQNSEAGKKCNDLFQMSASNVEDMKKFSSNEDGLLLSENCFEVGSSKGVKILQQRKVVLNRLTFLKLNKEIHYLESKCVHLKCKLRSMNSEIVDVETAVQSLEDSGETFFEKSYLVQIVHRASNILKQELS